MYKVQIGGKDCDGMPCNKVYSFDSYEEACEFVEDYNDWSDGLVATLINTESHH